MVVPVPYVSKISPPCTRSSPCFRHGYFHPCVVLDVAYPVAADPSDKDMLTMVPVYRGNVVKPAEAAQPPEVSWTSKSPEDLWCLVMTGLDTHLTQVRGGSAGVSDSDALIDSNEEIRKVPVLVRVIFSCLVVKLIVFKICEFSLTPNKCHCLART